MRELTNKLVFYFKKMDSLRSKDVSCDFMNEGVDLKLYMAPRGIVIYTSNNLKDLNPEWKRYISSMHKIDDNWYYDVNKQ